MILALSEFRPTEVIDTSVRQRAQGSVQTVTGQGDTLLSRMFSLIYLGDWVSYHLAYLNGTDPTPVPIIQSLKARLAGS